ncbi:hypothetical protein B0H14DRAFT_3086699 [Mycena olivaceomarginata]|nr:hypothetical protein B0H14DRAFT_3086699 [Mycena olivaceomarginata]
MQELDRAAYVLVRLAMFISKKALGSNTRAFNRVFAMAQNILRNTFGMARARRAAPATQNQDDLDEARKAAGPYILRSVLNERLIEEAALTREEIMEEDAADAPSDDDDDDGIGSGATAYGSIISWSSADHVGALGVLYVVLALILVSGRVMGLPTVLALPMLVDPDDLRATLKRLRLRLPAVGTIGFSAASTHRTLSLDAYLTLLIRQGFLDRQQVGGDGAGANNKGGAKGKRTPMQAQDDDAGGQQTHDEVGEKALAGFVSEFMVQDEGMGDAEEEEDARGSGAGRARTNKKKADAVNKLERMAKGIERAAEIIYRRLSKLS